VINCIGASLSRFLAARRRGRLLRTQQTRRDTRSAFSAQEAPARRMPLFSMLCGSSAGLQGETSFFENRYAENRLDRLPELAADLVRLKVDVIAVGGTLAPLAAKQATATIPIVMMAAGDPLGTGLVASLARPGGNVTGMSLMSPDLVGKRLQLLKEVLPRLSRVAVLWNAANPYSALVFKATQDGGQTLGIEVRSLDVRARTTSIAYLKRLDNSAPMR
jgi:ABC-type uncharacterized transport system substrate-binding protein